MKNELSNIYANQVLVTEAKKAKDNKVKGPKTGDLDGAAKAKPSQGADEKAKKELKKPEEKKEFSEVKGKPSKMKESQIPSAFNRIFQSVLKEDFDFQNETPDSDKAIEDQTFGNEFGDDEEKGEEGIEGEGSEEGSEGEEEDLTVKLQDIVTMLQDIVSKLSGAEEEEGSEEGGEVDSEEGEEGAKEVEEEEPKEEEPKEENPYEESLDLKGQLTELSSKLGDFLTKKTSQKVKGTLGKAKGGKASEGSIPEQDGKPKPFNPSLKAYQNPKGSNTVSNIKKGDSLIK